MREYIGVLRNALTGKVYAVIDPDDDKELDNPRFLMLKSADKEPIEMVKVPRGKYMTALTMEQLSAVIDRVSQT